MFACNRKTDVDLADDDVMSTLGQRLKECRREKGLRQAEVCLRIGIKQGTLSELENDKYPTSSFVPRLAALYGVEAIWLSDGKGPKVRTYGLQDVDKTAGNVSSRIEISNKIPLISWVQAGTFCQIVDLFEPGDAEEWLPSIHGYGPHAYALRVDGDSMVNPNPLGKTYPPGCVVFVDPDVAVTNGARVIAKIPGSQEATFKVFVEDAGRRYLRPLNPAYPTIDMTEEMLICGVVVGKFERE